MLHKKCTISRSVKQTENHISFTRHFYYSTSILENQCFMKEKLAKMFF